MKAIHLLLLSAMISGCAKNEKTPSDYVDPFVGTDGHGHTYPGAVLPFGMAQVSPDTGLEEWDRCSGYHYGDSSIIGFTHTHLSGTGRSDLLDVMVMPFTGEPRWEAGRASNPDEGYRSRFSHDRESARPGYYSVMLDDYGIQVELTATKRAGMHRYTFPLGADARNVILDLSHHFSTDSVEMTSVRFLNDSVLTGSRYSVGWGEPGERFYSRQKIFFAINLCKAPEKYLMMVDGREIAPADTSAQSIKLIARYPANASTDTLAIGVGISAVSAENALENLNCEIGSKTFDTVVAEAAESWNDALGRIKATGSERDLRVFYTALYHSMLAPSLYNDINGQYRGADGKIHTASGFNNYTVLSLWDTFRAANPLYTLIAPQITSDIVSSMLAFYDEYGLLPVWPLWSSETNCMIGYHSVPVIVEAVNKGVNGFDVEKAYDAMRASAMQNDFGVGLLKEYGYIPRDLYNRSVSTALEYCYDDWCLAQLAARLGKTDDAAYFKERAASYRRYFDPEYKLMNGVDSKGEFRRPFDPFFSSYGECDWVEGNSWQYSFFVPHDVEGLANLYGGHTGLCAALDTLFATTPELTGDAPVDITGLIGQYAHGNEPSHHIAYLYDYIGHYPKAQMILRKIMTELYDDTPAGLCGNEDCGQMSAWYVFSAMGFYPVNPASGVYMLGVPMLESAEFKVGDRTFRIEAKGYGKDKPYVRSIKLNGKPYNRLFIRHSDIAAGGVLEFEMGSEPTHPAAVTETAPGVFHICAGATAADVDCNRGARIISLNRDGKELLSGANVHPIYYGATMWVSPQRDHWPAYELLDRGKYHPESDGLKLKAVSAPDSVAGLRFIKEFGVADDNTEILLDYTIENITDSVRHVAVWDVVRVPGGITEFLCADTVPGCNSRFTGAGIANGRAVCNHDTAPEAHGQKLFAYGSDGSFEHRYNGLIFTKRFPTTSFEKLPPLQGEVEVFRASGGRYSELETHGEYRALAPGETISYSQRYSLK